MSINTNQLDVSEEEIQAARLQLAIEDARNGNPIDFARYQWRDLLLFKYGQEDDEKLFPDDLRIDQFQLDILKSVFDPSIRQVFIKGCTKPGKGFSVALAINIWYDIFPDSRIVLCGPSTSHIENSLFAEVATLRKQMRSPGPGNILTKEIKDGNKHRITIANPKSGEGFSGMHGEHVMFVFDEASIIDGVFYENCKKQARMVIALSNPRTLSGWFRNAFGNATPDECHTVQNPYGRTRLVTIGGSQCMNVIHKRLEAPFAPMGGITIDGVFYPHGTEIPPEHHVKVRPLIPAQLDYARFLETMAHPDQWHRDIFGEGKFPTEDPEYQVILSSWLQRHHEAWRDDLPVTAFGLDPAHSDDGDKTVLSAGGPEGVARLFTTQKSDFMKTVEWVFETVHQTYGIDLRQGTHPIAIDYAAGYGGGVGDRMRQLGVNVIRIRPNMASSVNPQKYENCRAEIYGELGARLDPRGVWQNVPWALPSDDELSAELIAPEKIFNSDGIRFRLIPKDKATTTYSGKTVKDKLHGRSPDKADSVALLYAAVRVMHGIPASSTRHLIINPDELFAEKMEEAVTEITTPGLIQQVTEALDAAVSVQTPQIVAPPPVEPTDWRVAINQSMGEVQPVPERSLAERLELDRQRHMARLIARMDSDTGSGLVSEW